MEFIEGETFAAEIGRGNVSLARTVEVVAAVAEALDFAHERGVVHRDIKPANLMILPDGSVKVADFGIARLTSGAASTTMTAGMMVGTPSYMSPEQVQGEPVDGRSDLYSLGCVLYEALTGRKPFRAETMAALLTQILTAEPAPPSQVEPAVPRAFDPVVLRAIARDRERRYQTGRELARELRATLAPAAAAAAPRSRTRWLAIAAILLLLVAGGGVATLQLSKPATGTVVSTSDPVGAEVLVDGKVVGRTPGSFAVSEGSHEIEYRKDGYFPAQATVNVPARGSVSVPLDLVPEKEEQP
jgi:serine/threonine-protein kinase